MTIHHGHEFKPAHIGALARFANRAEANSVLDKAVMKMYRRDVRRAFKHPTTYADRRIVCAAQMLIELGVVKPCAALIRT